jgi:serine/threonine protein kinase
LVGPVNALGSRFPAISTPVVAAYCGTSITIAPEILKGKPYDKKCDLWSLGVILFQLTFGKLPFPIDKGYAVFIEKVTT